MKFVYILENDRRFQREIVAAINQINPDLQIRIFSRLEGFVEWLKLAMTEGPAALEKGGTTPDGTPAEPQPAEDHELVLIISQVEIIGINQLNLLKKTRESFIQKKICRAEDPTAFVMTAFDDPNFNLRAISDPIVNNIIFKPFDRLILQQHLIYAIDGRHPPTQFAISNQKTTATFEFLKAVKIEGFSEIGFVTRSESKVDTGHITKYYSPLFATENYKYVMGICESNGPHPDDPTQFRVWVRYFSIDAEQISSLRKKIRGVNESIASMIPPRPQNETINKFPIVFVDPGEDGLAASLDRRFQGVQCSVYQTWEDFMGQLDPPKDYKPKPGVKALPSGVLALFFHHGLLGEKPLERWAKVKELFKKKGSDVKFFMLSSEEYTDMKEREYSEFLADIFYRPSDRPYIARHLAHHFPGLKTKEDPFDDKWVEQREKAKAAGPVKVVEFSEAGFIMEYHYAIPIGSFRELVPWQSLKTDAPPELMANCNYSEEAQGKKNTFLNHFVFFGMTDFFLKSIRIWIRNNYISTKEGSG